MHSERSHKIAKKGLQASGFDFMADVLRGGLAERILLVIAEHYIACYSSNSACFGFLEVDE
jgi:hypothetical protein